MLSQSTDPVQKENKEEKVQSKSNAPENSQPKPKETIIIEIVKNKKNPEKNYSIEVPHKFIDVVSQEVIGIPVICSNTRRYDAASLFNWFKSGNKTSLDTKDILNKDAIIFDRPFYKKIRKFFAACLERDKAILNDGQHDEALKIMQKHVEGFNQQDPYIKDLIALAAEVDVEIQGLEALRDPKKEKKQTTEKNNAPETVINIAPPVYYDDPAVADDNHHAENDEVEDCCEVSWGILKYTASAGMGALIYSGSNWFTAPVDAYNRFIPTLWTGFTDVGILCCACFCANDLPSFKALGWSMASSLGCGALSYATGLPTWAPPVIMTGGTFALRTLPPVAKGIGKCMFSLFHRPQANDVEAPAPDHHEEERLLPQPV